MTTTITMLPFPKKTCTIHLLRQLNVGTRKITTYQQHYQHQQRIQSSTIRYSTSITSTVGSNNSLHVYRRNFSSTSTTASAATNVPTIENAPWMDIETRQIYKYWTDNTFVTSTAAAATSTDIIPVRNPSTQDLLGHLIENTTEEIQNVVQKAKDAQQLWKLVPIQQRQRIMFQYQQLIRDHMDELVTLITLENGKTYADAKGDIIRGLEVVETSCQIVSQLLGNTCMNISSNSIDTISIRQPIGVCVGICPFNFPVMIPLWMFPLAIAAGNSFIIKPSHQTPGATLLLAQLMKEAGLPSNVLQVVHGTKPVVQQLITHDDVTAISFVGSDIAGKYIHDIGTQHGKRVQANLGAKNHAIVLPDSDRTAVIRAIIGAAFGAAGQRCMALSVVILVGETESWCNDIVDAANKLKVGAGWENNTDIGPVISIESKDRIEKTISKSVMQGTASVLLDGRGITVPNYPNGNFIGPTIIKINNASDRYENVAYTEEIFGPVLTILTANTLNDAMHIVNTNKYGNGVALFTQSGSAARYFTNHIECGQIGINVPIPVPCPMGSGFSFTGNKGSICNGDNNFYGTSGIHFYTQIKTITSNWPYDESNSDLGGVIMPTTTLETTKK